MNAMEAENLVRETTDLTGVAAPKFLDADAPTLQSTAADDGLYWVGLIGGKEVGKSALVNALAGSNITETTSHGPGTEVAVAYVHRSQEAAAAELLEKELPGRHRIVLHDQPNLLRQALLDLPDIDSRFAQHVAITRTMLRHMLFPVWVQSVEKYADAQPRNLLSQVAAGNDPGNFLFCLNKADQLPSPNGPADELKADYASRVAKVLSLPQPPAVFLISAVRPRDFDFPELARLLSREKSVRSVADSRQLAENRRQRSLLQWLETQDISGRAERLARLHEQASEILADRLGNAIVEQAAANLLDDGAYRMVMTDGVFARRVHRWPIVNILHTALLPLRYFVRENAAANAMAGGASPLVDAHLSSIKPSVSRLIQSAFAQLHQSNPALAPLYRNEKPWEAMQADALATQLRAIWIDTIEQQRQMILRQLYGRAGIIAPPVRFILTIGALFWFPILQPIAHTLLTGSGTLHTLRDVAILSVEIFSTSSLLKNAVFLLIWYFLLWLGLRWDTRRRVEKLLSRWRTAGQSDDSLNLTAQTLQWIDALQNPIADAQHAMENLGRRIAALGDASVKSV